VQSQRAPDNEGMTIFFRILPRKGTIMPWRPPSRYLLVVIATLLVAGTAPAQSSSPAKRPITVKDLWAAERVGRPALSPDGRWVAVEVTRFILETNASTSQLWLLATDGKTQKPLVEAKKTNSEPRWSPDGKTIAFVGRDSGPGKTGQIYLVAPEKEAKPRRLTNLPMTPSGLKWSADGRTLFCIVQTWPDTPDDDSYIKKNKAEKDSKVKALVTEDALYRVWDHWIADGKRPVVFAVDARTGKHRNLFAGLDLFLPVSEPSAAHYDVSPDGKELCFASETARPLGSDFNSDLYILSLDRPGKPRNITLDNPANDFGPAYSPDGKSIAFLRQSIKYFYADRARLMLHDRTSGKNREVTSNFDRSSNSLTWARDSRRIYFEAEDRGYYRLYAVATAGGTPTPLTAGYTDGRLDLSRDGTTLAFLRTSFDFPARVFVQSAQSDQPRRIDRFNDDLTSKWNLGRVKEVYFKGADDEDVQMWLDFPPGFDAKKKWPLLQVVHGGPHNGITTGFHYRWNLHLFASRGYVVACVNFHGSSGFGQKFTDSITGDVGGKPLVDVLKATDYMEKQPYIDRERMAAAGASYGGYMMAWLNGHTDRFKAMICHAGVYNWHGMMASDIVRSRERALGAFPWNDPERVNRQSPNHFAARFKTPTLVIHGEKDFRVPLTQGLEYYNTLRLRGVPARLLFFPDENHWVQKPQNSRLWNREVFAWLDRYIGHGPTK
jgi:dipeptidyl aminopeptidase/acylaminoacyl peptidase